MGVHESCQSMDSSKIMVCGDAQGKIEEVFLKIEKLVKKGNRFDVLFAVGDFFCGGMPTSWQSYKNGTKCSPIPTYILGPNKLDHIANYGGGSISGFELAENITYLGKKGVFTTPSGLNVVYLSGVESTTRSTSEEWHCFTDADVKSLVASVTNNGSREFVGVDVLLTSQWPKYVCSYGNDPTDKKCLLCGSELISQLALAVKPRYHFCGLENCHYERIPYRNHDFSSMNAGHITRFISLASVGNVYMQKSLYAFTITPMVKMKQMDLFKIPPEATDCPYIMKCTNKNLGKSIVQMSGDSLLQNSMSHAQYRWKFDESENLNLKRKSNARQNAKHRRIERLQNWSCWFCLGGEKVEKHLVGSVGNLAYLAMAKGGIVSEHVLILPIAHYSSSLDLPEDTAAECDMYKLSLSKALRALDKHCIFFERNYKTDHMQIQVVPVPLSISSKTIKDSFIGLGQQHVDKLGRPNPLEFVEIPKEAKLKQILPAGKPFFHVELPDGTRLLHSIRTFFPLQFGRDAICSHSVLNMPSRIDWKDCVLTPSEETQCTRRFRDLFISHDFTMIVNKESS